MDGIFEDDVVDPHVTNDVEAYVYEAYRRKFRRITRKLILTELLYEYAKNSTLHGLRYIVQKGLHLIERLFWLVTFFISLAICFLLMSNVYIKWKDSPVMVSFSEQFVPVEDVYFPSLTICPEMKSKATVYNYTEEISFYEKNQSNMTTERLYKLDHITTVCGLGDFSEDVVSGRDVTNSTLIEDILEVAPSVDDVFLDCSWHGSDTISCEDLFTTVLTKKGVCFNFNSMEADKILRTENLQKDYAYLGIKDKSSESESESLTLSTDETHPRKGRDNADEPNLVLVLNEYPLDKDDTCNVMKSGYTIYVQNPMDLPQASVYYYAASHGQLTSLALKFDVLKTADSLKNYSPKARQCYFPGDKYLRYFRTYTFNNCRLECKSNFTFELCDCVWFHMPHNDAQQICTYGRRQCVKEALEIMSRKNNTSSCQCLPLCDSVEYDAEVINTNMNVNAYLKNFEKKIMRLYNFDVTGFFSSKNFSSIEVYFKEPRFISKRRSELFGLTDFLANCGGLLGLFLGFSFLSLVEVFYFGTFRVYYGLKKLMRQEKKKQNEEKKQ